MLVSHPGVLETAVVAHRDKGGLEKPKAKVALKSQATGDGPAEVVKERVKDTLGK